MRSLIIPAAAAITLIVAAPAGALPSSTGPAAQAGTAVQTVAYYHRRHYRHGSWYRHGGWVPPYRRGFEDPGYAYHGNRNGCAVDLGYGRWESCDVGR